MYSHYQAATQESNTTLVWKKLSEGLLDSRWCFSKPIKWPVQQAELFRRSAAVHSGDNNRYLMCPSPLITDRSGETWTVDRKHRWHCINDRRLASHFDYRALICCEQTTDVEPRCRVSGWAAERAVDGITDRKQERVAERANAAVPTKSILLDFWLRAFITLYHCASWGLAAKNFNKSSHTNNTQRHNEFKEPLWFQNEEF